MGERTSRQDAYGIQRQVEGGRQIREAVDSSSSITALAQSVQELSSQVKDADQQDSLKRDHLTLRQLEANLQEFGADFSGLNDGNLEYFAQVLAQAISKLETVEISQKVRALTSEQPAVRRLLKVKI